MNTLLNPRRISAINSQSDIALYEPDYVYKMINDYMYMCKKDAESIQTKTVKQHLVPRFLLANFEGSAEGYPNRLRVVRYKIHSNGRTSMDQMKDITSASFSRQDNFYTIDEYYEEYENSRLFGGNDKYRMEKLLSVIERNTAPILKVRQKKNAYLSSTFSNPYIYPEEKIVGHSPYKSFSILESTTGKRVALSVFFAVQYLRSHWMHQDFLHNEAIIQKMSHPMLGKFTGTSFPDFIDYLLPKVAASFYGRAWRWVYSDYDGLMPGGTAILPLLSENTRKNTIAGEDALVMSLGRNSTIYFLKEKSFVSGHDGVFISRSLALSVLSNDIMVKALAYDTTLAGGGMSITREAQVCMHPDTNLAHIFKTGQEPNTRLLNEMESLLDANAAHEKSVSLLARIPRK